MVKEFIFTAIVAVLFPAALPATMPVLAKAAIVTVAALPIDVAINTATGGTPGKTISGDTARARTKGSKLAAVKCDLYTVVAPYDLVFRVDNQGGDHCDKWQRYEARPVDPRQWDGVNQ